MKWYEIHFMDLERILIGEVPTGFLFEVVLRISVLFVLIIVSMRLLGRRMTSSLNRHDMAAMVSLAAAIGVPLQDPSRGILPAMIIAIVIVSFVRTINILIFKSKEVEKRTQGNFSPLVIDGVLQIGNLIDERISRERLFAQLRSEKIESLGQLQRVYLESSGSYSVLKAPEPKPGLSAIPQWDKDFTEPSKISSYIFACNYCGWINENKKVITCPNCRNTEWENAVLTSDSSH